MMFCEVTSPDGETIRDWFSLDYAMNDFHLLRLEGYVIDILDVRR